MRHQAYASLLDCCERLRAGWWAVGDSLRSDSDDSELWEQRFLRAQELWTEFQAAAAVVSIAGPHRVADAVAPLSHSITELDTAGTKWRHARQVRRKQGLSLLRDRFDAAIEALDGPLEAFQQVAREVLETD
jgi:hypothetical protein